MAFGRSKRICAKNENIIEMIGSISLGKSFYHCISYCLEDKRQLTEEETISLSLTENLQHNNRAEVLEYNKCFGDKYELAEQFKDVRQLSKRVEKPVLHMSIRLAPGETLTRQQLTEMGRALAKEFGVYDNQYLTILHKDTRQQHIHLVANRVGYNGKAASTSNNFLKMDRLCRRLEKEYKLKEVLSARRFLSKEQRLIPRNDSRKEQLRTDIRKTLEKFENYSAFDQQMKELGYTVLKGRRISFIDNKKVKIKGSEVGFSLATINKILHLKYQLKIRQANQKSTQNVRTDSDTQYSVSVSQSVLLIKLVRARYENSPVAKIEKELSGLLNQLLKPEYIEETTNQELLQEAKKKKHRLKIRH
jgi:Relaxase/Mobilisation nuclease domain